MAEINTTNLSDLPSNPGNVQMQIQDSNTTTASNSNSSQNSNANTQQFSLDQSTISQIVNGLQQASISGATRLPSRDIPMNQNHLTHDEQIRPNYVPINKEQIKYINDDDHIQSQKQNKSPFEKIFDYFQLPLLLAIMYFIFEMPSFKSMLLSYIPFLFKIDGNYNFNGITIVSISFSLLYYLILFSTNMTM